VVASTVYSIHMPPHACQPPLLLPTITSLPCRVDEVYPQNVALSFTADRIHMSGTVPDGSASGSNIREAEKAGQRINYGGQW
jgi:hypothetical protein